MLASRSASPSPPVGLLLLASRTSATRACWSRWSACCSSAPGSPLRVFAAPAVDLVGGAALYVALRPYALARVRGFLDPWQSAQGEGFQLVQSFVAFGRGGSFGVGLGAGRQKLFYLPEAHTDFILSVVAEELGLVGVLLVLGAFAAFADLGRARRAPRARPLRAARGLRHDRADRAAGRS